MVTGVVLGNGPSREKYDFSGDVVIACNIPGEGFSADATVITDTEIVWLMKNNPELITCPLIISKPAYEKMKELRIVDRFEIHEVFTPVDWYTSAHYATMFLTKTIKCDRIDIWGCDSYFVDDASSTTDSYVPKSGDVFYKQWRNSWARIFRDNPHVYYSIRQT